MSKTKAEILEYHRNWYAKNKERLRQKKKIYCKNHRLRRKEWFATVKGSLSCEVCGESRYYCLDFHHTNPKDKEFNIGDMVERNYSKKRILEEIAKCTVLCANCHREEHHKQGWI